MLGQPLAHVAIDLPTRFTRIAVSKVVRPTAEVSVQLFDQLENLLKVGFGANTQNTEQRIETPFVRQVVCVAGDKSFTSATTSCFFSLDLRDGGIVTPPDRSFMGCLLEACG